MTQPHSSIADQGQLQGLAQRNARSWAFHILLLGLSGAVAAFLMSLLRPALGIGLGLLVAAVVLVAAFRFTASHQTTVARFARLNRMFWPAHGLGLLLSVAGALVLRQWPICVGGTLSLVAALAVAHFVYRAPAVEAPAQARH